LEYRFDRLAQVLAPTARSQRDHQEQVHEDNQDLEAEYRDGPAAASGHHFRFEYMTMLSLRANSWNDLA
jgi:hypothetical protein